MGSRKCVAENGMNRPKSLECYH